MDPHVVVLCAMVHALRLDSLLIGLCSFGGIALLPALFLPSHHMPELTCLQKQCVCQWRLCLRELDHWADSRCFVCSGFPCLLDTVSPLFFIRSHLRHHGCVSTCPSLSKSESFSFSLSRRMGGRRAHVPNLPQPLQQKLKHRGLSVFTPQNLFPKPPSFMWDSELSSVPSRSLPVNSECSRGCWISCECLNSETWSVCFSIAVLLKMLRTWFCSQEKHTFL